MKSSKSEKFECCHTNVRQKIRFNIDKAEKMSSIDGDKIMSGFDLQNTGKQMQFLSKVNRNLE